jgi:hypothetical protein
MPMDTLKIMSRNSNLVVLPRYLRYLAKHGDEPLIEAGSRAESLILEQLTATPRDRTQSFSASSAGYCERAQVFGFYGAEAPSPDPQLAAIFNDGKWRHIRWQALLLTAEILDDIEEALRWNRMLQRGTMDGIGHVPDDHYRKDWRGKQFGFELKGVNAFQFDAHKKNGPTEKHLKQIHRYFLISGLELFSVVYENKSTQEPYEWVIEPDPVRMDEERQEVANLKEAIDTQTLPPMLPECVAHKATWKKCNYGGPDGVCSFAQTITDIQIHKNRK